MAPRYFPSLVSLYSHHVFLAKWTWQLVAHFPFLLGMPLSFPRYSSKNTSNAVSFMKLCHAQTRWNVSLFQSLMMVTWNLGNFSVLPWVIVFWLLGIFACQFFEGKDSLLILIALGHTFTERVLNWTYLVKVVEKKVSRPSSEDNTCQYLSKRDFTFFFCWFQNWKESA